MKTISYFDSSRQLLAKNWGACLPIKFVFLCWQNFPDTIFAEKVVKTKWLLHIRLGLHIFFIFCRLNITLLWIFTTCLKVIPAPVQVEKQVHKWVMIHYRYCTQKDSLQFSVYSTNVWNTTAACSLPHLVFIIWLDLNLNGLNPLSIPPPFLSLCCFKIHT